jgi:hypothetical protein
MPGPFRDGNGGNAGNAVIAENAGIKRLPPVFCVAFSCPTNRCPSFVLLFTETNNVDPLGDIRKTM